MTVGSVAAATLATAGAALGGAHAGAEVWLGMAGPLLSAVAFWTALARRARKAAQGLTRLVVAAFAVKFVFFAAYVVAVLQSGWVRPKPFVACFAVFYVALHLVETSGLRRMGSETFGRGARTGRLGETGSPRRWDQ
jgi:hypothetical protein